MLSDTNIGIFELLNLIFTGTNNLNSPTGRPRSNTFTDDSNIHPHKSTRIWNIGGHHDSNHPLKHRPHLTHPRATHRPFNIANSKIKIPPQISTLHLMPHPHLFHNLDAKLPLMLKQQKANCSTMFRPKNRLTSLTARFKSHPWYWLDDWCICSGIP